MSGAQGYPFTKAGTATTTETSVPIVSPILRGAPNSNGTRPTVTASSFLRGELNITNLDPTNNLVVRFNGRADRLTVRPGVTARLRGLIVWSISVQSSASTVAYDIAGSSS